MSLPRLSCLSLIAMAVPLVGCASVSADAESAAQAADFSVVGDGVDPASAPADSRVAATTTVWGRSIRLHLSDAADAGWASIDGGAVGDETWLDRSYDGGLTWDGRVGTTKIPKDNRGWRTLVFELDDASHHRVGALRACGKAGDRVEIACTPWFRTTRNAKTPLDAAATSLMAHYDVGSGTWSDVGWWNSANALTAMIDYQAVTGNETWSFAIGTTFAANGRDDFTNDYMDDTAWWGLAWLRAYDVTRDAKYLAMAKKDADYLWSFEDDRCGGGVWWSRDRTYKNAITNELYIKLAAGVHNRTPGDTTYAAHAGEVWRWFEASGLINGQHLINDGLDEQCHNNNGTPWTYNQGVILGGLVELAKATGDASLLARASVLANASTTDPGSNPNGVLRESCESAADHCGKDGPSFKGIYARNLGELDVALAGHPYHAYLQRQADALAKTQDSLGQYGLSWAGPIDATDANRQHSALDALVAAARR